MSNQLATIETKLASKETMRQFTDAWGADEKAQSFMLSVISEIQKTVGAEYGDISVCVPDSIVRACLDAAKFQIPIDGRKFAHLEARYDKSVKGMVASFQIDTNGLVYKIKERYPDFIHSVTAIFKGDEPPEITIENGQKTFKHTSKNVFASHQDIVGFVVSISYTNDGGEKIKDVHTVSREEMDGIKAKGKGTAWRDQPLERMKTAALKRACKWHFRTMQGLQDLIRYDNEKNFSNDLTKLPKPQTDNIIDNINMAIEQEKVKEEIVDVASEELAPEPVEKWIHTPEKDGDGNEIFRMPGVIIKERPKQTFKILARGKETEFDSIEAWGEEVKTILKEYTDVRQFSMFVQKNSKNIDAIVAAGGQKTADEVNTLMIELQAKLQREE